MNANMVGPTQSNDPNIRPDEWAVIHHMELIRDATVLKWQVS